VVAVTFVWQTMLNPQFGIVNAIGTSVLGWDTPVAFLSQRSTALATVMAFEVWRYFPFAFLFLTARIAALPADLEEAAVVDGATVSQRFRYVVFPQLLPTIALLAVLRFIFTFNEFDDIYLLTGGAAGTQVASVRVYDLLTARGDIGAASAQALVLALVLVVLLGLYFRFVGRRAGEET
jgi:multiple sugar transport system permease protein